MRSWCIRAHAGGTRPVPSCFSKRMQMEKQDEPAVRGAEDAMCAFDKHSTERSVLQHFIRTLDYCQDFSSRKS